MELLFKKGDKVIVTEGAQKGNEGIVSEIRPGVTYSVQVLFKGQTVSTPYAPNELGHLNTPKLDSDEDDFPVKGCSILFIVIAIIAVLALFYWSVARFSAPEEPTQTTKPLSDTVARIPNPIDTL